MDTRFIFHPLYRDVWIKKKEDLQAYFDSLPKVKTISSSLGIPFKYTGGYAMIPGGLDLEAHLEAYPLTNYFFVRDNRGKIRSYNHNGTLGQYFDINRLRYIIGLISSIPAKNKDSISEDGYVNINSKTIQKFFKDYLPYLDYLLRTGIFITDNEARTGKSKGYKFSPQYEDSIPKRYCYNGFENLDQAVPEETYDAQYGRSVPNPLLDFSYLAHWYETKKLTIDTREALRFAYELKERKFREGMESWDINKDKSRNGHIVRKFPRTQYYAAIHNINALDLKHYNAKIDNHVHRLHSVITNIQKEYRQFLKYDGQPLIGIDITNCQPYLLSLLFNSQFWEEDSNIPLTYFHPANSS